MATESGPTPIDLQDLLREGIPIAAILLFWGILAALVGPEGLGGLFPIGSILIDIGTRLSQVFIITGFASVLIYVIARGLQFSRR